MTAKQPEHESVAPNQKPPIDLALRLDYLAHIQHTQQIIAGLRDALSVALAMIVDRDRRLKSATNTNAFLRLQLRALISRRALGEQRQAEEAEVISPNHRSDAECRGVDA